MYLIDPNEVHPMSPVQCRTILRYPLGPRSYESSQSAFIAPSFSLRRRSRVPQPAETKRLKFLANDD